MKDIISDRDILELTYQQALAHRRNDSQMLQELEKQMASQVSLGWGLGAMAPPNPQAAYEAKREMAAIQRKGAQHARLEAIKKLTEPNMLGFFPKYDEKSAHSNFAISQFDTETADDNRQIIEFAGVQVVWNKDLRRFEQPKDASAAQLYRVYNPTNASFTRTQQVHGQNAETLKALREHYGAKYSTNWDASQLKVFEDWAKSTVLTGHNILNADLPWLYNKPSGGFTMQEPTYKQAFIDTYHLSEALLGKGKQGEGRNKLQNLAKRFGISASSLGIPAHAGWADSVLNIKVLEKLINTYYDSPVVQEFLAGLDAGNIHSHKLETPDPLQGSGYITHTISGKGNPLGTIGRALKKVIVKTKEKIVKDIPAALGLTDEEASTGNWDRSSYEEMSMSDTDEELKEMLEHIGNGSGMSKAQYMELMKRLGSLEGWNKISYREKVLTSITNKGLSTSQKEYALKNSGFVKSEIQNILHRSEDLESGRADLQKQSEYRNLRMRSGRFLAEQAAAGYAKAEWFETLREAHRSGQLTEDALATAKQSRKNQDLREAQWEKDKEARAAKQAYLDDLSIRASAANLSKEDSGFDLSDTRKAFMQFNRDKDKYANLLYKSDIPKLEMAAAEGTEAYADALDKIIDRNQKVLDVSNKISKIPIYNPMNIIDNMSSQYGNIRRAAHGILPSFMEKPLFRFSDAIRNQFEMQRARAQQISSNASVAGKLIGGVIGGIGGGPLGVTIGSKLGEGIVGTVSQFIGNGVNAKVTEFSEGIQHRLNLLGMATSTLGAFINGLKIAVGLFSKLGQLWNYMPSYTQSTLTGVQWQQAQPLMAADRLLGFKEGTLNSMYNTLAFQQADLYTSGQYNEQSLVAAARLGIFNLAYAPMGGDAEEQQRQIVNKLYGDVYNSGLSKAQQQSKLSLIKNYDPNLINILERMHGLGLTDYSQLTSNRGWRMLSQGENARVSRASWDWDLNQRSNRDARSLAGARVYDIAKPLTEQFNKALWAFATGGQIDWQAIADSLSKVWNNIVAALGDIDKADWSKVKKSFSPVLDTIFQSLKNEIYPRFRDFLTGFVEELSNINIKADFWGFFKDLLKHGGDIGGVNLGKYFSANSSWSMAKKAGEQLDEIASKSDSMTHGLWPSNTTSWYRRGKTADKWLIKLQELGIEPGSLTPQQTDILAEVVTGEVFEKQLNLANIQDLESFNSHFRIASKEGFISKFKDWMGSENEGVVDDIIANMLAPSVVGKVLDTSGKAVFDTYESLLQAVRQGLAEAGLNVTVMNNTGGDVSAVGKLQNNRR